MFLALHVKEENHMFRSYFYFVLAWIFTGRAQPSRLCQAVLAEVPIQPWVQPGGGLCK